MLLADQPHPGDQHDPSAPRFSDPLHVPILFDPE